MFKILLITFGNKLIIKVVKADYNLNGKHYDVGNVHISFGDVATDICTIPQTIKVCIRITPDFYGNDIDTLSFVTLNSEEKVKNVANTIYETLNTLIKTKPYLKGSYVEIVSDIFDNSNLIPNSCLKINALKIDNNLFIQIADMKDSDIHKKIRTPNGFCLHSVSSPEICPDEMLLYVRGDDKQYNNHVCCGNFAYISLMEKYIDSLKLAVKQWNNDDNDNNVILYDFLLSP